MWVFVSQFPNKLFLQPLIPCSCVLLAGAHPAQCPAEQRFSTNCIAECVNILRGTWVPECATARLVESDLPFQALPGANIFLSIWSFAHLLSWWVWKASRMHSSIFISAFVIYMWDCCSAPQRMWHLKSLKNTGWAEYMSCHLCFFAVLFFFLCKCCLSLSLCLVLKMLALANPWSRSRYLGLHTLADTSQLSWLENFHIFE